MGYKKKIGKSKIALFAAVIGLLVFSHFLKLTGPLESGLTYAFNPFFSALYSFSTGIRSRYETQVKKNDLSGELKSMEAERNRFIVDTAKMKGLEDENESLRKYLGFFEENQYRYIMAAVISRTPASDSEGGATINKGAADGLAPGLAVINNQGIIIGKVNAVKEHVSSVSLTTDTRCELAAAIKNSTHTSGITKGDLGLTIRMDYVPQTENLKADDIVVTSGLEAAIPRGLVIGKIEGVSKESNELWQTAVIDPLLDLNELTIVSVIIP